MKKYLLFAIASVFLALLLTLCAKYEANTLSSLSSLITESKAQAKNNDVMLVAKAFNPADCNHYLDRDIIAAGYRPVQIHIQNNSDKAFLFSPDRLSVSCATAKEVAKKVHTSIAKRIATYTAQSLILWPLTTPAIVDGIKSSEANKELNADFSTKVATKQTILPHTHFNQIVFVPSKDYDPSFSVTLIERESGNPMIMQVSAS